MFDLLLGLGSNRGNRLLNLSKALVAIESNIGIIYKASALYETEAWGLSEQDLFLNQALWLKISEKKPKDVLHILQQIELKIGRVRSEKWGPREIDIDILYFGTLILMDDELKIPHPEISRRRFVLVPLAEIAPDFKDPVNGFTVMDLMNSCADSLQVRKY